MGRHTGKVLMCICFMLGTAGGADAERLYSIPKVGFTFDFNTFFSGDNTWGLRMQIFGNNRYFNKEGERKAYSNDNTVAYVWGVGFGSYKISSIKHKDGNETNLYHAFAAFAVCYRNRSVFEPFAGVYPGVMWGLKSGFFANPTAGVNILAFKAYRNWNSALFQTFVQFRAEYNTMLSSPFFGCGILLQIM